MPKIEKDLLKVKGSDGQWHYIPAVGGGDTPTWGAVQNKPFESLGGGLEVDENGVLSAKGGTGGSPNAVQYVAQELTDEQKTQARTNIDADKKRHIYNATRGNYGRVNLFDSVSSQNAAIDKIIAEYKAGTEVIMRLQDRDFPLNQIEENAGKIWFSSYSVTTDAKMNVVTFMLEKDTTAVEESYINGIKTVNIDSTLQESGYAADAKAVGDALGTKLDKNQGVTNAGKILGVGEDGNVTPQDKPSGSTVTVDSELSSTSLNPVQNKIITAALAEKITAPTTAAVGQIIKVKSVDGTGKPTEWEAVDMPSGGGETWELIRTITTTEIVSRLTISQDESGKPFTLSKFVLGSKINITGLVGDGAANDSKVKIIVNDIVLGTENIMRNRPGAFSVKYELNPLYNKLDVSGSDNINPVAKQSTIVDRGIADGVHSITLETLASNQMINEGLTLYLYGVRT